MNSLHNLQALNLTGNPVCGNNVTDMSYTYLNCYNLTGSPVCGNNVTNMSWIYYNCFNLTGSPVCGNNVTSMSSAYEGCYNIAPNAYFYSNKVNKADSCFGNRTSYNRINVYVPIVGANTTHNTLSTFLYNDAYSIVGSSIEWTNDMNTNSCYYNTTQNIYIYPVESVAQVYKDNELLVARYTMSSGANVVPEVDSATITTMEDTTNDDGTITRSVYLDESQAGELPSSISFNGEIDLLTVEKLKIDNVTDTSYIFNGCSNLTSVCAMDWDTSKITKADYMFAGCSKLTKEENTRNYIPDYHLVKPIKTRRKLHTPVFAVITLFKANNHPHNLNYQQPSRTNIRNSKSPVILKHIFTYIIFIHSKIC